MQLVLLGRVSASFLAEGIFSLPTVTSSQGDSGFPTELAAACYPGSCSGNTTWLLHHLFLAPGHHS